MRDCKTCIAGLLVLLLSTPLAVAETSAVEPGKTESKKPQDTKITYKEDVVYGRVRGAGLLADIAYPESKQPLPAIISVHGGRWRGGDKRDGSTIKVQQWAGFGLFAMSIDYRLVGCTPAPACYQDMQCAIRYVHAHAKAYNIDEKRIFLIGQSAGGHMVSLAATLGDGPFPRTGGWEKASNDFRAAISVAANYELTTLSWGKIWTPRGTDPIKARKLASPVNHVSKKIKPLLILHSDNDRSVPIANALMMVDALKKAGATHTFHRYPKMGHMGITPEVIKRSLEFIKQQSSISVSERVFSGPQIGEKIAPFKIRGVFGDDAGKDIDLIARAGGKPMMLIFLHTFNESVFGMMRILTNYAEKRQKAELMTGVIWLSGDPNELEVKLKRAQRAMPKNTPIGISPDGQEGPGAYGLNRKVSVTVIIAKDNKVAANFALIQPSIRADAVRILGELVKVTGGKAPTLAQLTKRNRRRQFAVNELEKMLSKTAKAEDIVKSAKAIEDYVKKRAEVRMQIGNIAYEIIKSDRFKDRNPKALDYLRKWAKQFRLSDDG